MLKFQMVEKMKWPSITKPFLIVPSSVDTQEKASPTIYGEVTVGSTEESDNSLFELAWWANRIVIAG